MKLIKRLTNSKKLWHFEETRLHGFIYDEDRIVGGHYKRDKWVFGFSEDYSEYLAEVIEAILDEADK